MFDKSIPYIGVIMTKTDTKVYPRYKLPEGFVVDGYKKGYEDDWARLMLDVEQADTLEQAKGIFESEFLSCPEMAATQCLFVHDASGELAACASLWHADHFGQDSPRIHWVAVSPKHQGKGLAKALMTELFVMYNKLGLDGFIYLTSQTWSYKAINIYKRFGFAAYKGKKPVNWADDNFDENRIKAWKLIDERINNPYSIAYCGLARCVCAQKEKCVGCQSGGCDVHDWCKNYNCCREKGLNGCWECSDFPCEGTMLDKPRIRAFARFAKEYGTEELAKCLLRNKENGIVYHYDGQLVGDYDRCATEDEIIEMIKRGSGCEDMSKIESRCGLLCSECDFREKCNCGGCVETNGHPFHGECPVAKCCQDKGYAHCGQCPDIPVHCGVTDCEKRDANGFTLCDSCGKTTCGKLHAYSYTDPEHGDNPPGARVEQCKKWAKESVK